MTEVCLLSASVSKVLSTHFSVTDFLLRGYCKTLIISKITYDHMHLVTSNESLLISE
jgi:hypothetical protein